MSEKIAFFFLEMSWPNGYPESAIKRLTLGPRCSADYEQDPFERFGQRFPRHADTAVTGIGFKKNGYPDLTPDQRRQIEKEAADSGCCVIAWHYA